MKTYRVLLLTALCLFSKGSTAIALTPMQTGQCSASGIQLVVSNFYAPPRLGVPDRRVGAGTR